MKKLISLGLCSILSLTLLTACKTKSSIDKISSAEDKDAAWAKAAETPYGAYPELVTYTTGMVLTGSESKLKGTTYEADTTENNAYTRYIRKLINAQNKNVFEAIAGDTYDQKVSLAVASGDIPDIMYVSDYATLKQLVENDMVEDLTEVFETTAAESIKKAYASYDKNGPLEMATFDGKLRALPKTQLSDGQQFLWLRKDWMDKLGLKEPKKMEDIENILTQFIKKDPGNNGAGKTVGLVVDKNLYGNYPNGMYGVDNIFTAFEAYPGVWMQGKDGLTVYGSVQKEMKHGVQVLADWYKKGLIDVQFPVRTHDDLDALISSGKCGAFIGAWWNPFTGGMVGSYTHHDARWVNYSAPVGSSGKINAMTTKSYSGFVVVRKGYKHPELAVKILNIISDYSLNDKTDAVKEVSENMTLAYLNWPLYIAAGNRGGAEIITEHISQALNGKLDPKELTSWELGWYQSCKAYEEAVKEGKKPAAEDYSQYMSRMVAIHKITDEPADFLTPAYFETTDSMKLKWDSLKKIELETIIKIIIGEAPIDSFDEFVNAWNSAGGKTITEEVRQAIEEKQ